MSSNIIIPGVTGRRRQIDTDIMTRDEMIAVMKMHEVCQRHNIGLLCPKCDSTFQGNNTGHERCMEIRCKCRVLRADMGAGSAVLQ